MNYRHIYHAGNFADVFKHVIQVALLQALQQKDKPYCYLDTHAGIGLYDLSSEAAQKTLEHQRGVSRVMTAPELPPLLRDYRDLVQSFNTAGLDTYPGSPCLAKALLRPQDRAILVELHPEDAQRLKSRFEGDDQVAVHHGDAYHALKAFAPPKERRGLVLIDPPFEQPDEFGRLVAGLKESHRRWPQGIYALWYPVKDRRDAHRFHGLLERSGIRRQLLIELMLYREERPERLNGTGMIVVNPPWQIEERLRPALASLAQLLAAGEPASTRVEWLVPE